MRVISMRNETRVLLAPSQSALFPILTFSPFVSYLRTSTLTSGYPWVDPSGSGWIMGFEYLDVEAKPAKRQRSEEVLESVQEQTYEEQKTVKLSQEQLNQMVIIVPNKGINVEALQTKYPIVGWEVYSEDTMQFWKIIRVGNHIEVYQVFEDMLKNFDRDDLVKLWSLVQERYNSSGLTEDKEIELWVELKMLFEPDAENLLELHKCMHDPLKWWLYDMCAVHHVSVEKGQDIFMLVEKDYPLTNGLATLMLCNKLRVDQQPKLSTARPKLSTDSTKIKRMKLEASVEERRIFKCWFNYHTTNGHQFTMSIRHQELASLEQTTSELASPKQTALGKDISNPLIVDSLLKTIWLSMHHVIAMKHWLFQSKWLPGPRIDDPQLKRIALSFIRELVNSGENQDYNHDVLLDICTNHGELLHQSSTNVYVERRIFNFVALILEDLAYQIDNIDSKKQDKMFYPRFIKIIIHHFPNKLVHLKEKTRMFMHIARADSLLGDYEILSRTCRTKESKKKIGFRHSSEESPSMKKYAKAKKVAATKPKPTKKKASVKAD
ncbi:hypothetical protein Tco_1191613 [Tanacetum coccineum]